MVRKYEKVLEQDYKTWYQEHASCREQVAADPRRLAFHLMPRTGWMNDPNGLCQVDGVYHIYYQYTPFEPTGELKLWGHYTTKDFVSYVDEGPVLFPDSDLDAHGAYSGSAYVEDGTIHFFYTGNLKYFDRDDYDYINTGRGSNTIAFTSRNGHDFSEKQLLMTTADYPADMSCHVRDPKVFRHGDAYYMVLGARSRESRGMVLLYRSEDLKHWTYKNRITTPETFGYMWECPDLFEIDGQWFLTCCPQGVAQQGIDFENVHQNVWMKLDYDFETDAYEIGEIRLIDRGFDFYAQQTFEDEKGRRILIGWMGIPDADYTNPTVEAGWQHALTLPRELTVRDGRLVQNPVEELKKLRDGDGVRMVFGTEQADVPGVASERCGADVPLVYEAVVEFRCCDSLHMTLRRDITLSYENQILTLNLGDHGCGRTTRSVQVDNLQYLQIFVDTSSVEVFVNHGEETFTSRIYSMEREFCVSGDNAGTLTVYPLKAFTLEDQCDA